MRQCIRKRSMLPIQPKVHTLSREESAVKEYTEIVTRIHLEDIPRCQGVWKGVNSRFYQQGRLSHLEECNWQFHNYLADRLRNV